MQEFLSDIVFRKYQLPLTIKTEIKQNFLEQTGKLISEKFLASIVDRQKLQEFLTNLGELPCLNGVESNEFIFDILQFQNAINRSLIGFAKFYEVTVEEKYLLFDELAILNSSMQQILTSTKEQDCDLVNIPEKIHLHNSSDPGIAHIQKENEKTTQGNRWIEDVKDYAIFQLNKDGTIASWNAGASSLQGYSKDDIIGKHFSIFYTTEKQASKYPDYELVQASIHGRFEDEGFRVKKDGTLFWANVVITTIYDNQNEVTGFTKITRDLTERKKTEDALRSGEARLRAMIGGVKEYAIILLDPDGTIANWNEGAKKIKGYEAQEILGKHFSAFYPEEKLAINFPALALEQARITGKFEDEGVRLKKDGSTFWAHVLITAISNDQNELIGFIKVTRDLTDKKNAEEDLKRSEARFRNLIQGVKDYAIYMLNVDGTVASWNEGATELKGYTQQEIAGKHFSLFYPEDKKKEKYPEYELEVATKVGRFEDEGFRVRKDGTQFWANVIITAIYSDENELLGFTKITRDLTERKLAEESLRRSEERSRLLIEAVKDYSIFMVDTEGRISSWNEGAKRLKGYTEKEVLGQHISLFYTKEQQDESYPDFELEQAKQYGRFEDEGLRIKKDGTSFYANVVITALFNKEEKLIGFSKITRDLTEKKAYEDNLKSMNNQLEEKVSNRTNELSNTVRELKKINNDLDNFIYTASHDLKAPISNIEGLISGMLDELGPVISRNETLTTFSNLIYASIRRFQKTIQDLTNIAKTQRDLEEEIETVNIQDLVDDVKLTIADLIAKNEAKIICDLEGFTSIRFIRKNLYSIFYNLISNAVKYRSDDRKPVITIHGEVLSAYLLISFKDNGLGLREESLTKMFTMFKRFHDHVEGSGVGLYIVKRLIENAGGMIEVLSTEGEGSEFRVFIPIANNVV